MKAIWGKVTAIVIAAALAGMLVFSYVSAITNYDFTVFIFAGAADQITNRQLIDAWKEQYVEQYGDELGITDINVGISFQSDTNLYFSQVQREIASGKADDIFYVSPKYVKSFALNDAVLDLTDYVDWNKYDPNGVWSQAVGAYAYVLPTEDNPSGSIGDPVTYVGDPGASGHEGSFQTADGRTAGVYALPKDFSSFGLAYNRNFFTGDEDAADAEEGGLRYAYTHTQDTGGAVYYIDANGNETGAANIVNIGRTVRYYPFNYYKYATFSAALAAGDPVAAAADSVGGYDVTLTGWPGETYIRTGVTDNPNTTYDDRIGYVTYTYAEYGAMAWAVGYYASRYDEVNGSHQLMTWLNDEDNKALAVDYVYGNDQYEGPLYLTAWLLGNGVDIINEDYTSVTAPEGQEATSDYGINSDKFKEAYAAFLAFGSDWNANSFYSGSGESAETIGGWATFNGGRCIFYGCGTWDFATFNSTDQSVLAVGIMPEPVSESYSPYARIKDANYQSKTYGTAPVTETMTDEERFAAQEARQESWAARLDTVGYGVNAAVLDRYTGKEAWKVDACADLCAYLTLDYEMQRAMTYSGSQLTSFVDQGVSYLYYRGGAPDGIYSDETAAEYNFDYMITPDGNKEGTLQVTAGELKRAGVAAQFGAQNAADSDTFTLETQDAALIGLDQNRRDSQIWTYATAVAAKLFADHQQGGYSTIADYITRNFPSMVPYLNPYFTGSGSSLNDVNSLAYAFKCLNLIALNYEDRNLQLRMASGTNGALDSCMYTYNSEWIDEFGATKGYTLIAYKTASWEGAWTRMSFGAVPDTPTQPIAAGKADGSGWSGNFYTPANFCEWIVRRSQARLDIAVDRENEIINLQTVS